MTVAEDRWAKWARQIDGRSKVFKPPKPPARIERALEVRWEKPGPMCQACGERPIASNLGLSELCAWCWHKFTHDLPGCGCPYDILPVIMRDLEKEGAARRAGASRARGDA